MKDREQKYTAQERSEIDLMGGLYPNFWVWAWNQRFLNMVINILFMGFCILVSAVKQNLLGVFLFSTVASVWLLAMYLDYRSKLKKVRP